MGAFGRSRDCNAHIADGSVKLVQVFVLILKLHQNTIFREQSIQKQFYHYGKKQQEKWLPKKVWVHLVREEGMSKVL